MWITAFRTAALAVCTGMVGAQTVPSPPPAAAPPGTQSSSESLKDLDAMTLSCPRAALNAAAREAAKVHSLGAYQFVYFNTIAAAHHASYEVHFQSSYVGEPELKYCVKLYCQQGWDPGVDTNTSVTLLSAGPPAAAAAHPMSGCMADPGKPAKTKKPPAG